MLRVSNLSICGDLGNSSTGEICLDKVTERVIISTAVIIIMANTVHLCVTLKLQKRQATVFSITLTILSIVDILNNLFFWASAICEFRRFQFFSYPLLSAIVTFLTATVSLFNYIIMLFEIIERWLLLAVSFQYKSNLFIRRYKLWVVAAGIFCFILNMTTHVVPFFLVDNLVCFEVGLGLLNNQSEVKYLILTPYIITAFLIIVFACLFLRVCLKMRKVSPSRTAGCSGHVFQACRYVLISTIIYTAVAGVSFIFALLHSVLKMKLKPWASLFTQTIGVWNMLAFYVTFKSYRERIRQTISGICKQQ